MLSVSPRWCVLIASGRKSVEIRKRKPSIDTPFKCYIYCTQAKRDSEVLTPCNNIKDVRNEKVIGEFVCDWVRYFGFTPYNHGEYAGIDNIHDVSCVNSLEMYDYIGDGYGYGWHITDVVIYDQPKEIGEFKKWNRTEDEIACAFVKQLYEPCEKCTECNLRKPPQSYCFVEELSE